MLWTFPTRTRSRRCWQAVLCGWFALAACGLPATTGSAQDAENRQPTIGGFLPAIPTLPTSPPKPVGGPQGIGNFVDTVSNQEADALIEVVLGRPRLLTFKNDLGQADQAVQIAVGDPTILDFDVLSTRQVRLTGYKPGSTDLAIIIPDGTSYVFRIQVIYDLDVLRAQLKAIFPDASLRLAQIREHVIIEGQARDVPQMQRIVELVNAYLQSMAAAMAQSSTQQTQAREGQANTPPPAEGDVPPDGDLPEGEQRPTGAVAPDEDAGGTIEGTIATPVLINLIRIPGSQQVSLKVSIAELNRTALRRCGVSWNDLDGNLFSNLISSQSGEVSITGTFNNLQFEYFLRVLRRNNVLKILAEPNVVALHGHAASFLAGGEFPITVPQQSGGGASTVTVQFRQFGVRLGFLPFILDNERIRLTVIPEVSTIDNSTAVTLVAGGSPVPGLQTRRTETTVELRQGQTFAIAGLMQVTMDGTVDRIPGLGDLPYIGTFFQNNTNQRTEKELLISITPYLVEPMNQDQVGPRPGDDVYEPNDMEFFFLGRLESRTGRDFRSTVKWDDPLDTVRVMNLEKRNAHGQAGLSQ